MSSSDAPATPVQRPTAGQPSVEERLDIGRQQRMQVPLASHEDWTPSGSRTDPIELLRAEDETRLPHLLPVRYQRMSESPFTFFRATAVVMAGDLVPTPRSGAIVQLSGDAHLANFGGYGTPERTLVFDLNDFDETLLGPWEWDLKRLATSVVLACRENGFSRKDCRDAARETARAYRERMARLAPMGYLTLWYSHITSEEVKASSPKPLRKEADRWAKKARNRDHMRSLEKLTSVVDGELRITDDPPLIVHESDAKMGAELPRFAASYRDSLREDIAALLDRYTFVDSAQKVVGVGSVGTRCYIVLMRGADKDDPLFLQIKEASASALERHLGASPYDNHGQRIVRGQHAIQAGSDIFLGWGQINGVDFYVRQLHNMKSAVETAGQPLDKVTLYGQLCGHVLARAHARTGDAAIISGYLGESTEFDDAIGGFAMAYADQTEQDYAALMAAIERGDAPH